MLYLITINATTYNQNLVINFHFLMKNELLMLFVVTINIPSYDLRYLLQGLGDNNCTWLFNDFNY